MKLNKDVREYFAKIGSKGGKNSKRKITPQQQKAMQKARKEARRKSL